ncbi:hypothetical protein D1867_05510 [Acidianus infernus]|uniref:Uncharacterized protein n=2 Tax=Acidianus infernus TaxID=12915 RepID=A0A6A9QD74_ACIIN|nr:hypothetical protein [Acidianus infernus]MUM64709.1 hypothetical protein [Acidianus infernus]
MKNTYYIMGCKVTISQVDDVLNYTVEEPTLTLEEEKALKSQVQLPQNSIEKINYYREKMEKFGNLTCLMLDKNVEEIECIDISKPLNVKIKGLGRATTNIKVSRDEILDIFSKFMDSKNYRRIGEFIIIENDKFRGIIKVKEDINFNIIKNDNYSESITELISEGYLNKYSATYLWHIIENSGIIIINGNKRIANSLAFSLVNLVYNKFNKIVVVSKSKIRKLNELIILNGVKNLDIIDYYNPDLVLFDYVNSDVITKIIDLNIQNKGVIVLSGFPDNTTFLSSLLKFQLLSLSKLPTVLVEIIGNYVNIHELYSTRTKVRVRKVCKKGIMNKKEFNYSIILKNKINTNNLDLKISIIENLTNNNILDKYEIREKVAKIGEKIEPEI